MQLNMRYIKMQLISMCCIKMQFCIRMDIWCIRCTIQSSEGSRCYQIILLHPSFVWRMQQDAEGFFS